MMIGSLPSDRLAAERWKRQAAITVTLLTVLIGIAMAIPTWAQAVQSGDDYWHDMMVRLEWLPLVIVAKVFSFIGGVWATVPVWILIAIWFWSRGNRKGLLIWVLSVGPCQLVTTICKNLYARPRPDDRLLDATTYAFPSGHASNAAVVGLALVLAILPGGKSRRLWLVVAVAYAIFMGWTRTYLRVHWASDVAGGLLLGACFALWSAILAQYLMKNNID